MKRHPKKDVREAIETGEAMGWQFEPAKGHAWAKSYCPCGACRIVYVWSTPKNPGNHANQLTRAFGKCPEATT